MNEQTQDNSTVSIASIPGDVCQRCMKSAEQQEVVVVEVSYPGSYRRSKLCLDCQADLCLALSKALSSVFDQMVPRDRPQGKENIIVRRPVGAEFNFDIRSKPKGEDKEKS